MPISISQNNVKGSLFPVRLTKMYKETDDEKEKEGRTDYHKRALEQKHPNLSSVSPGLHRVSASLP